jgi:nucleoside-diphosphate-sugar epimerase
VSSLLVVGSTGLVGSHFLNLLHSLSSFPFAHVTCTYHNALPVTLRRFSYIHVGDLQLESSWRSILASCNPSVIVLISNIRHCPPLLRVLQESSLSVLPRLIVVGTTGVYSSFHNYSSIYREIELRLSQYPASACLLRPSMIYGSLRDRNMHRLVQFISKFHFYPIFGSGSFLIQPVYYKDVSQAILYTALHSHLIGSYNIPGRYPVTYAALVSTVFSALSLKPCLLYIPLALPKFLLRLLPVPLRQLAPVSLEQIDRLSEHKVFNYESSISALKYDPLRFEDGLAAYLSELDS